MSILEFRGNAVQRTSPVHLAHSLPLPTMQSSWKTHLNRSVRGHTRAYPPPTTTTTTTTTITTTTTTTTNFTTTIYRQAIVFLIQKKMKK